jgi:hypothetical protein
MLAARNHYPTQQFTSSLINNIRLRTLYTQLGWVTLALPVLPRLLAQSCPGLFDTGSPI